jgi:hypothetical protein
MAADCSNGRLVQLRPPMHCTITLVQTSTRLIAEACHDAQNHQSSTPCCDDWLGASFSAIGSHGGPTLSSTAAMTPRGIDQMREVLGRMYKRLMMHRFTNQALFAVMIGMELPTAQLAAMEGIVRFKSTRKEAR